jgi:hypothetical protein
VPSRYLLPVIVLFLACTGQAHAQANCTGVSNDPQGAVTWVPQWCQEFNAATGSPDTTVWSFDLGNGGFGNKEVETYCGPPGYSGNPSNCPTTFSTSTSNAYLDGNGHLVIQVINNSGTWFSARMKTQGLQNFQYGRIESSIQLPDTTNQGLWPAFWSLGSNIATVPWPGCGEVDFMENWSPQVNNGPGPAANKTTLHKCHRWEWNWSTVQFSSRPASGYQLSHLRNDLVREHDAVLRGRFNEAISDQDAQRSFLCRHLAFQCSDFSAPQCGGRR